MIGAEIARKSFSGLGKKIKNKRKRKKENKAGYTATLVACGWLGAVMKLTN